MLTMFTAKLRLLTNTARYKAFQTVFEFLNSTAIFLWEHTIFWKSKKECHDFLLRIDKWESAQTESYCKFLVDGIEQMNNFCSHNLGVHSVELNENIEQLKVALSHKQFDTVLSLFVHTINIIDSMMLTNSLQQHN